MFTLFPSKYLFSVLYSLGLWYSLPDPAICLQRASELVNPGGILVLTTPFSWMEAFTPKEKWYELRVLTLSSFFRWWLWWMDMKGSIFFLSFFLVLTVRSLLSFFHPSSLCLCRIGGKYEDNKSVRSADALVDFLSTNFDLIEQKPVSSSFLSLVFFCILRNSPFFCEYVDID